MECKNSHLTVSLTRCDDINFNKNINLKDAVKNKKTVEVKRSLRLSRKRTFQDELVKNNNQSNKKKIIKKRKCNETKPEEPIASKSGIKKSSYPVSALLKLTKKNLTNKDAHEMLDVQQSLGTTIDNTVIFPIKIIPKTLKNKISTKRNPIKNMSCNANENYTSDSSEDNVEYNRKRGRPLITPKINIRNKKVDKQKIKNPAIIIKKLHNIDKSESPETLDDNTMLPESNNKSNEVEKNWDEDNSSVDVKSNASSSAKATKDPSETVLEATTKALSVSEDIAVDDPRTLLRTYERHIYLLSKRFNISLPTLENIVIKKPLSVFREKFSKFITPSMLTVSPIVHMTDEIPSRKDGNLEKSNLNIIYKVEPIKVSEVYEKTNLKDCINELSKTMPSWSVSIVPNPSRYVIYQMSINTYGIPVVNKSIVLDRYFRASVYVNQCLQYKYCKRYHTATEIINLIKELNDI